MVRILLLILLVWLVFKVGKRFIIFLKESPTQEAPTHNEKMVKCTKCDTYIPESESMTVDTQIICKRQPCKK
jgi:formylmethanofuran dehydrogenase subunit E